jgi:hypothetical protein
MWQGEMVVWPGLAAWVRKKREQIGGAHMALTWKRGSELAKRRNSKEKVYSKNTPGVLRLTRPMKEVMTCRGRAGWLGGLDRLGRIPEKKSNGN